MSRDIEDHLWPADYMYEKRYITFSLTIEEEKVNFKILNLKDLKVRRPKE